MMPDVVKLANTNHFSNHFVKLIVRIYLIIFLFCVNVLIIIEGVLKKEGFFDY